MKLFLPVLLFCCLAGCKSDEIDTPKTEPRELNEAEKPLVGSYSNTTGEQEVRLVLDENGYCELLQDGEKLDDKPMKWGIYKSEVSPLLRLRISRTKSRSCHRHGGIHSYVPVD